MKKQIINFIKKSVKWLQKEQQGCCHYKLDDHLAVFVGWSEGYGEDKRDDVIQAKNNLTYGINVGIKVWTSDAMLTDFDYVNFPYYDDGEVLDMTLSIAPNENYNNITNILIEWYDEIKDLILQDDGKILKDDRYNDNVN